LGVLPFKDLHKVKVNLSIRNSDHSISFLVGSVDGNYQLESVLDIFPEKQH